MKKDITKARRGRFTKRDKVHYVIYKELDILGYSAPYEIADLIVTELEGHKLI